jgi:Flp pilus assembly protein TadD
MIHFLHRPFFAAALVALVVCAAYGNSFHGDFVFDDEPAIVQNPSIRRLWPLWVPLDPPKQGETVTGRPALNLSFALNYAVGGLDVRGYHVTNLVIHILAAWILFGLIRRTLLLPSMRDRWAAAATPIAFSAALIWAVHPLQTESVTYIVQRAESLVGLFYLLTLYGLLRGSESVGCVLARTNLSTRLTHNMVRASTHPTTLAWYVISVLACLLGMASKEVMVSAPIIALLYDRTFLAGSFREALRRRYGLYLALAATYPVLEQLVYAAAGRGGTAGFGQGVTPWQYLRTQFVAIVHYLKLCFWPHPLVLDYGTYIADDAKVIVPCAIIVILLGILTLLALWRWPKVGFLGACFFALLAPTSSIVPVHTQTMAEHRMYLPLAAVVVLFVACGGLGLQYVARRFSRVVAVAVGLAAVVCVVAVLAAMTNRRNLDYRDSLAAWTDVAVKIPGNFRVWNNLASAHLAEGQAEKCMEILRHTEKFNFRNPVVESKRNILAIQAEQLRQEDAESLQALRLQPDSAENQRRRAWFLATSPFAGQRNAAAALEHAERAFQLGDEPSAEILDTLAAALAATGDFDKAQSIAKKALQLIDAEKNPVLAGEVQARLELYQRKKPYYQPPPQVILTHVPAAESGKPAR